MEKVLLIDDSEDIRTEIKKILTYEDYDVIVAENGRIGLQLVMEHAPDVILCDVIMPGMNGYAVLSELRKNPQTVMIPLIFLTAKTARQNVRHGMNLGADDYLTKPVEIDELLASISAVLEKQAGLKQHLDALRIDMKSILPHEIWRSLADITAFSEFLLHEESLPEPREIVMTGVTIHDTALHLQHLVENYLMYVHLKFMESTSEGLEEWPPDEMIETGEFITFLAENQAECSNRKADLMLDLIEAPLWIARKSLQEIVMQLLDNALKFSESGTRISIVTYRIPNRNQLAFRMTDQGAGMSPEQLAAAKASRYTSPDAGEERHSGFGLAICHLLARLHHADMTIESAPNAGTTVTVIFQ
jgi:DNA-binding response OmpR family regulator/anti-sigma regulatory factor (Ser/Thr protein kinase)